MILNRMENFSIASEVRELEAHVDETHLRRLLSRPRARANSRCCCCWCASMATYKGKTYGREPEASEEYLPLRPPEWIPDASAPACMASQLARRTLS